MWMGPRPHFEVGKQDNKDIMSGLAKLYFCHYYFTKNNRSHTRLLSIHIKGFLQRFGWISWGLDEDITIYWSDIKIRYWPYLVGTWHLTGYMHSPGALGKCIDTLN
jgi:hypothetical protein